MQPAPNTADAVSLPPTMVSVLIPHISERAATTTTSSSPVTAALTQRVKVLQEENDELYDLLKLGETGKLKEDARALKRVVQRLEVALKGTSSAVVLRSIVDSQNPSCAQNRIRLSRLYRTSTIFGSQPQTYMYILVTNWRNLI